MRIAVTYDQGQVFQHFGHTERFKVYDIEGGEIKMATTVNTNGKGHGSLAGILQDLKVETLICGGIGGGAKRALSEAGIQLYGGVSKAADRAVADFLAGKLSFNPDVVCNHHGEHHGGEHGENCGHHHCGGEGNTAINRGIATANKYPGTETGVFSQTWPDIQFNIEY